MRLHLYLMRQAMPIGNALYGVMMGCDADDTSAVEFPFSSFTVEHYQTRIPQGSYPCDYYDSPRNRRIVPRVDNVPGREEIEIHPANWWEQVEGCIAVGDGMGLVAHPDTGEKELGVTNSVATFEKMMTWLNGNPVQLEVFDR